MWFTCYVVWQYHKKQIFNSMKWNIPKNFSVLMIISKLTGTCNSQVRFAIVFFFNIYLTIAIKN